MSRKNPAKPRPDRMTSGSSARSSRLRRRWLSSVAGEGSEISTTAVRASPMPANCAPETVAPPMIEASTGKPAPISAASGAMMPIVPRLRA